MQNFTQHKLENFPLNVKGTNEMKCFNLLQESELKGLMKCGQISRYDMNKLEVEYDYDTDKEQITYSQEMLFTDLKDAVEWYVQEDPLKLVSNFF